MSASPEYCADKDAEAVEQERIARRHDADAARLWTESEVEWEKYADALDELAEITTQLEGSEALETRQAELETQLAEATRAVTAAEDAVQQAEGVRDDKQWLYDVTFAELEAVFEEYERVYAALDTVQDQLDALDPGSAAYAERLQEYDDLEVRLIDLETEFDIVDRQLGEYEEAYLAAEAALQEKQTALDRAQQEMTRIEDAKQVVDGQLAAIDAILSSGRRESVISERDAAEFNAQARAADAVREELLADEAWDLLDEILADLEEHCDYVYEDVEAP